MAGEHRARESRDNVGPRVRGIGARTLLAATVAVPLIGLAAALWPSVDRARDVSADAVALERAAEDVETYSRLDGALLDEMSLAVVRSLVDSLGIPLEMTAVVFGADPVTKVQGAIAVTDDIIVADGLDSVREQLDAIRADPGDMAEIQADYAVVRGDVRAVLDAGLDDLAALPRVSSPELVEQIDVLTAAIAMRTAISDAYYAFFSVVFDTRDAPSIELTRLIDARERFARSIALIEAATPADPDAAAMYRELLDDPAIGAFTTIVDDLIADGTENGVADRGLEPTLANALSTGIDLGAAVVEADASAAATLRVIEGQAEDVVETAGAIRLEAARDTTRAYLLAGALLAASFLVVAFTSRFIAGPLRRLEDEVDQLHAGAPADDDRPLRGPREVKTATLTLRRASEHFSLATSQARRLAAGDLDAEELDQRLHGGLGDSLQAAVDRLRAALAHQNEFRRRLSHEATHDGLTQIPNRNASIGQLTRALARSKRADANIAVLFIDLDNFKSINDHHGHQAGDAVLVQVARRLVNSTREGDFVGRLGGDEFLVVAEPVRRVDEAMDLAERLLGELAAPIALPDNTDVRVKASIGVAVDEPAHLTAEELLRDADLAVYRAKAEGRGGVEICDEALRERFVEDNGLVTALERAIANDEFVLHFQPIVGAADHRPQSLEALVRWERPDTAELVPPGLFIEFAERSPLIVDIDRWVVDAVARQLAEWQADPRLRDLPVSVNISGRHLLHPQLSDHILEPLARHGVDPGRLIVELTESALVEDLAGASEALRRLRDAGVAVAIDDFGTGYTSLAHLRALPVDILKIDRSFTASAMTDAGDASIVKLIIDAGHLLGATVTAEGVETVEEAERLTQLGTDTLQGFYFAVPRPADEMIDVGLVAAPTAAAPDGTATA